jgi:hypothetical protein
MCSGEYWGSRPDVTKEMKWRKWGVSPTSLRLPVCLVNFLLLLCPPLLLPALPAFAPSAIFWYRSWSLWGSPGSFQFRFLYAIRSVGWAWALASCPSIWLWQWLILSPYSWGASVQLSLACHTYNYLFSARPILCKYALIYPWPSFSWNKVLASILLVPGGSCIFEKSLQRNWFL